MFSTLSAGGNTFGVDNDDLLVELFSELLRNLRYTAPCVVAIRSFIYSSGSVQKATFFTVYMMFDSNFSLFLIVLVNSTELTPLALSSCENCSVGANGSSCSYCSILTSIESRGSATFFFSFSGRVKLAG